jgi:hypothetical protein
MLAHQQGGPSIIFKGVFRDITIEDPIANENLARTHQWQTVKNGQRGQGAFVNLPQQLLNQQRQDASINLLPRMREGRPEQWKQQGARKVLKSIANQYFYWEQLGLCCSAR